MSGKYATPLRLEPGPSRVMGAWLVVVHLLPVLMFQAVHLSGWLNLALSAAVVCSLYYYSRLLLWRSCPQAICGVCWGEARYCQLALRSGEQVDADLGSQAFVLPWLVIMHFYNRQRQRRHLVIFPDMLTPDTFRKLRVRLMLDLNQSPGAGGQQ